MITKVILSRAACKALQRSPKHVVVKLLGWVDLVENEGLENARKIRGFNDKPLRGRRRGQRSIRLSRAWRAIYVVEAEREGEQQHRVARVTEVTKHGY